MRKIVLLTVFLIVSNFFLKAQKTIEFGGLVGGVYYLGDINHSTQFYSVEPGVGVFARHNLNKRWAFRLSFSMGRLSARDKDFNREYQHVRNAKFSTVFTDLLFQTEFNFLPYKFGNRMLRTFPYTPYIASGAGLAIIKEADKPYKFLLPMTVGFKWAVSKKLELGLEWSFRKTYSDNVDNFSGEEYDVLEMKTSEADKYRQRADFYGKDWYSFANLFVTYKIFQSGGRCKAYDF